MSRRERYPAWGFILQSTWIDQSDPRLAEAIGRIEAFLPGTRFLWGDTNPDGPSKIVEIGSAASFLRDAPLGRGSSGWKSLLHSDSRGGGPNLVVLVLNHPAPYDRQNYVELRFGGCPLLSPLERHAELMISLGEMLGGYLGTGIVAVAPDCGPQPDIGYYNTVHTHGWPPREYPRFYRHQIEERGGPPHRLIPDRILWLNYWGPATCELVGFPPAEKDRDAYARAWPLPGGGYLWQLTDEALDLRRADHRQALRHAYDVFLEIGNRNPRSRWPRWRKPWHEYSEPWVELHFACPPRVPGDGRPLALVEALEGFYREAEASGEDFEGWNYSMIYTDDREAPKDARNRLLDRAALLRDAPGPDLPTLETGAAFLGQYVQFRYFDRPAPGYLYVRMFLQLGFPRPPTLAMRRTEELLETFAGLLGAYWGRVMSTSERIATEQQVDTRDPRDTHPEGLPILRPPEEMADPQTPPSLGWLNYWSEEACRRVGLSPADPGPWPEGLARRTRDGGWIWRVTPELLNLRDPEQRAAFARAYERFPAVGGRTPDSR